MGHVILPTGASVWVESVKGSINLDQLIKDMKNEDYTSHFRISMIHAISRLHVHAKDAIPYLKDLAKNPAVSGEEGLLAQAAEQAIKKIDEVTEVKQDWQQNYGSGGCGGVGRKTYTPYNGAVSGTSFRKNAEVHKVTFTELGGQLNDGLKVYCRCDFCDKLSVAQPHQRVFSDRLAGPDRYFCNFCVRNDYYSRSNSNIMILTYRGIIGYYYYAYYVWPKSPTMYVTDINDYIEIHTRIGLQNPIFRYDPDTFCWFVDFGKVSKRKMPLESVLCTIIEQLACFNLYENVKDASPRKLYEKYLNAVTEFSQTRTRTNGDKVFAPTLFGCDIPTRCSSGTRPIPVDTLQNFTPPHLVDISYSNRTTTRRS